MAEDIAARTVEDILAEDIPVVDSLAEEDIPEEDILVVDKHLLVVDIPPVDNL